MQLLYKVLKKHVCIQFYISLIIIWRTFKVTLKLISKSLFLYSPWNFCIISGWLFTCCNQYFLLFFLRLTNKLIKNGIKHHNRDNKHLFGKWGNHNKQLRTHTHKCKHLNFSNFWQCKCLFMYLLIFVSILFWIVFSYNLLLLYLSYLSILSWIKDLYILLILFYIQLYSL